MVMANPKRNLEREAVICSLYRDGKTLQEVGDVFGLTRERVRQILRRAGVSPTQGGVRKRSERSRLACLFGDGVAAYANNDNDRHS